MPKPKCYFVFDIEARGPDPIAHGMVSFGYLLCDTEFGILESSRINVAQKKTQVFEEDCYKYFWAQRLSLLMELTNDTVSEAAMVEKISAVFEKYEYLYDITIVGDFLMYDATYFNTIRSYNQKISFLYTKDGGLRDYIDLDSWEKIYKMLGCPDVRKVVKSRFGMSEMSHFPDEDCIYIMYMFRVMLETFTALGQVKTDTLFEITEDLSKIAMEP